MKKLILTLCLTATGTFAAVAQMRLTLDQALDLALSENPTIKVAEMEVQRYDYVKRQTWGGLLPQVSVTGQVNHSFIVQQMSKGFSLGNDPYTTLSGAVDASGAALRAAGLPHDEDERQADGHGPSKRAACRRASR